MPIRAAFVMEQTLGHVTHAQNLRAAESRQELVDVTWIPITFECTILFSALTGFFSMWILNGLPRPHHPIFSAKNFERATIDRFFLCIEARDPKYDDAKTRDFLKGLSPLDVSTVEEPED